MMLTIDKNKKYYIVTDTDAYGPLVMENYLFESEKEAYEYIKGIECDGNYHILECTVTQGWKKSVTIKKEVSLNEIG